MSQLIIPLYFTPVPISLGSFGVMLIALLYGRKLGTATVLSYVAAGSFGAPIFAGFKTGFLFSPTGGYILGYIAAALILGFLCEDISFIITCQCRYFGIRCISIDIICA